MTKLKENNLIQNHEIKKNKSHKKIEEKKPKLNKKKH